jgi:hypothetical protein
LARRAFAACGKKRTARCRAGHAVAFKNGDKSDIRIENLECITRSESDDHGIRSRTCRKTLASAIQLLGAVQRQINKRTAHAE